MGTRLGVDATVLYIAIYLGMNLAAFAVVVAVEKTGGEGDHIGALRGLGSRAPWLAWPMTIAMLALAGIPGTAGFIGKFQLIHALVDGNYTWLAIVLVVASMISLGYYLRVVTTMWMTGPAIAPVPYAPIAGGSQEADADGGSQEADADGRSQEAKGSDGDAGLPLSPATAIPLPEIAFVALLFAAATVFFGIFPSPLFDLVNHAGAALSGLVP